MFGMILQSFSFTSMLWTILVLLLVLGLTYDLVRRIGLPPGPYGLPFVGYSFFIQRTTISQQIAELCKQYHTDILSIPTFGHPFIILNTYELVKEVFQRRNDVVDRIEVGLFRACDPDFTGIIASSGDTWRQARRFSVSMLRDFGMGRVGAEESIQNESKILADLIKTYKGKPMDPRDHINVAVSNIICGMVFGRRFEHNDSEFSKALNGMNTMMTEINSVWVSMAMRYTFTREYVIKSKMESLRQCYKMFSTFVQRRIHEHRESFDGEVTDMIYGYLKEMKQGRDPSIFDDKMLESLIVDYFFAGSETTYSTLRWCLLAMAAYPDVQQKVQEELDEVIGDRPVSMSDKKQTPYTEAVLCEIQRHYTLVPLGVKHCNLTEYVTINGYRIPRGSVVMANIRQIHHDENTWKNPEEFDPTNFYQDKRVENLDKLVPFGIGRRSCAGEALARMELYMFFTSLVKEFEIRLETDDTKPDFTPIISAVYQPKPFKVRMIPRRSDCEVLSTLTKHAATDE